MGLRVGRDGGRRRHRRRSGGGAKSEDQHDAVGGVVGGEGGCLGVVAVGSCAAMARVGSG